MTRAALCCLLLSALCMEPARAADPLQIKTRTGKVQGALSADQKVRAFKGIPFAAPPTGSLRWQPPQPAAHWKGTRAATDFGPHCFQSNSYPDMVFHDPGPSEDCLTLNVWTPAGAKAGSLPVMVWIFGGGFSAGSTSENRQDGQFLAGRNVVVVSMNYRLGIFGFLVHPELTAESPQHASGNYGLLDQSAALAWVRANIRSFGGDPNNITLFGESAGSTSVSAQMASPLSRNLFAKAIGESGGAFNGFSLAFASREQRESRDTAALTQAYGTSRLAALRQLSPEDLLKPFTSGKVNARFGACVDGYFLPRSPESIYAAGEQAHIPLLAGWNANEGGGVPKVAPTAASFAAIAQKDFHAQAPQFLSVYGASDAEAPAAAVDYAGDRFIAFGTWRWLEAQVLTAAAPVFRYRFDLGNPGDRNHRAAAGAFHSDDIEYVFGTLDSRPDISIRPEDRRLSDQVGSYWTNFARTGNPNGPGLPQWPVYNPSGQWQVMHLDATSLARPDEHRDRDLFLQQFFLNNPPK